MARFVVYIAASVDGRIADGAGSVAWLDGYSGEDYGYAAFYAGIGTVVMGRKSYAQCLAFDPWPYAGRRAVVVTHRPLAAPAGVAVETFAGDVAVLADALARDGDGRDIWIMGGGDLIGQFLDAGRVDRMEVYVVPVVLGAGAPLFPGGARHDLALVEAAPLAAGVVRLTHAPRDRRSA